MEKNDLVIKWDDDETLPIQADESEVEQDQDELDQDTEVEEQEIESTEIESDPVAIGTYQKLVELGYIDEIEEFDGKFETIDSALEGLGNKVLKQAVNELQSDGKSVLEFIVAAGTNLTRDELFDFVKTWKEESRTEFTVEDEARQYLESKLKTQGLRDKAITAQLDDLEDEGELLKEANKLLAQDNSKSTKLIEDKQKQQEQIQQSQKQWYSSINEELKQAGYNKRKQQDILNAIPKANELLSNIAKTPSGYVQLVDLLLKFNPKDGKFDMSVFEKQAESKSISTIQKAIQESGRSSAGTKTTGSKLERLVNSNDIKAVVR